MHEQNTWHFTNQLSTANHGDYIKAVLDLDHKLAENISRVLYPNDNVSCHDGFVSWFVQLLLPTVHDDIIFTIEIMSSCTHDVTSLLSPLPFRGIFVSKLDFAVWQHWQEPESKAVVLFTQHTVHQLMSDIHTQKQWVNKGKKNQTMYLITAVTAIATFV